MEALPATSRAAKVVFARTLPVGGRYGMAVLSCYPVMMTKPTLSLQLFSLRQLGSLDDQLSAAARAGFRSVEPLGHHLEDPAGLRRTLALYGLTAPTAHIGFDALRDDPGRVGEACSACGIKQLFIPQSSRFLPQKTTTAWQRLGAELGRLAERYKQYGVSVGYHNMADGFALLPTARYGIEVLFEAARGSPLIWQADIAWMSRAGANPAEWLQRYSKILASAHVKDRAPEDASPDEDGWADVGTGTLTWPSLWRLALANGARTLVVEHDSPRRPFEFAQASFAYLSRFMAHSG